MTPFHRTIFLLSAILVVIPGFLFAQQQFAPIGKFQLENGEYIEDCKIGFRTFGSLNTDSSNVVIYPTWFAGTTEDMIPAMGPDKLIDSTKYFIICLDALGNGVSSSPSNSETQPDDQFPEITVRDMVCAEYTVLTEYFGFDHIFCAIGGSMGSMQVFEMITRYPDFIDIAIPYVCTPRPSTYDLLRFETQLHMINSSLECGMPENSIIRGLNMFTTLTGRTPDYIVENVSWDEYEKYVGNISWEPRPTFSVYNWKAQLKAMLAHDIGFEFGGSMEKAAERIKADLLIIVSETDMIVNPKPALDLAETVGAETLILTNNCGHLAIGCDLELCRNSIQSFMDKGFQMK